MYNALTNFRNPFVNLFGEQQVLGTHTTAKMKCGSRTIDNQFTDYLIDRVNSFDDSQYRIARPKYMPATADFRIWHKTRSRRDAFVELKLAACRTSASRDGMTKVSHDIRFTDGCAHYFALNNGRWTFIMSEIESRRGRITDGGIQVPRRILVLHRTQIPRPWSQENSTGKTGRMDGWVPDECIIHMNGDWVSKLHRLLDGFTDDEFSLPDLSELREASRSQVDECARGFRITPEVSLDNDISYVDISKNRYAGYVHQAKIAWEVLQQCRAVLQGVIYDSAVHSRDFRFYPFTYWQWSAADVEFTAVRDRSPPVEPFENLPVPSFAMLGFTFIRGSLYRGDRFVDPRLMSRLRSDYRSDSNFQKSCIVVFTTENAVDSDYRNQTLFAIPATAIKCDDPDLVSTARWQKLVLVDGETIQSYRFRDMRSFIEYLCEEFRKDKDKGTSTIVLGTRTVELMSRWNLFSRIDEHWAEFED